jgi:hypothetical protein
LLPSAQLVEMAAAAGLHLEDLTYRDPGSIGWNRFGWVESFRNLATARWPRAAAWRLGRLVSVVLSPLERSGGRGAAYTAVFRKR